MPFRLGSRSRKNLVGVHPDLTRVVKRAIEVTPVDFTVTEGMRTLERQKMLLRIRATRTLKSRHLTGHAVDLAAWVDGEVSWHWPLYFEIARAMQRAGTELGLPLVWGGVWDRVLTQMTTDLESAQSDYVARWQYENPTSNRGPLLDGPHFQLPWDTHPLSSAD